MGDWTSGMSTKLKPVSSARMSTTSNDPWQINDLKSLQNTVNGVTS